MYIYANAIVGVHSQVNGQEFILVQCENPISHSTELIELLGRNIGNLNNHVKSISSAIEANNLKK